MRPIQLGLFDPEDRRPERARMPLDFPVPIPPAGKALKLTGPKGQSLLKEHPKTAMFASWAFTDYCQTFGARPPEWLLALPAHERYWLCAYAVQQGWPIEDAWEGAPFR
jgi:hypothetical protein